MAEGADATGNNKQGTKGEVMKKLVIASLNILLAVSSGFTATVYPTTSDALWSNPAHWNNGVGPATGDTVALNSGRTLTADTTAQITNLQIQNNSSDATLVMQDAITLNVTGYGRIGFVANTSSTAIMNHSAGTLNASGTSLSVSAGSGGTSTYNLSGSAVLTGTMLDVGYVSDSRGTGTVTFNQSGGTVSSTTVQIAGRSDVHYAMTGGQMSVTDMTVGSGLTPAHSYFEINPNITGISIANDLNMAPRGWLDFDLSATGATTIDAGNLIFTSGSAGITVDASGYTGGAADIDLVTFSSIDADSLNASNLIITNLDSSLTGSIEYDADSMYLHVIPEPASVGMFVISGLALLAYRLRLE